MQGMPLFGAVDIVVAVAHHDGVLGAVALEELGDDLPLLAPCAVELAAEHVVEEAAQAVALEDVHGELCGLAGGDDDLAGRFF